MRKIKCYICGTEFEGGTFDDCPYCDWTHIGYEADLDKDEYDSANPITIEQAKKFVSQGLNIWGEPLPKRNGDKQHGL